MFPREQEDMYETQESRHVRPSDLSSCLPRYNSHPSGLDRAFDLENRRGDNFGSYRELPSRENTNQVYRSPYSPGDRVMLDEGGRLPRPTLPSMATLMQLNTQFHDQHDQQLRRTTMADRMRPERSERPERQHPELSRGRSRAQTTPQIYTNMHPVASTILVASPRATVSTSSQMLQREMASEPPLGLSAFASSRFTGVRIRCFSSSPINRSNRWTPYASVPISTGRTASRESIQPLTTSWDDDKAVEAEVTQQTHRRGRMSPRQRLAASKAPAMQVTMGMDGERVGIVDRLAGDRPEFRFHDRRFEPSSAPFASPPPTTSIGFSPPSSAASSLTSPHLDDANTSPCKKTSRYLREIDRRTILARLDLGEKQSALAKEFQVTRAAICNLNKHRDLVLARQHEDPFAKHPKKSRYKQETGSDVDIEDVEGEPPVESTARGCRKVQTVAAHPAERLIPLLLSSETSDTAFRHYCDRLMTLVVEEALAWAHAEARTSDIDDAGKPPIPCGVAIAPGGTSMLSVFQGLEPELPSGYIELGGLPPAAVVLELPPAVASHNMCLFYTFTDDIGEVRVEKSIRELLNRGAVEKLLCLVTLGVSATTAENLQRAHPNLRIATAHIEIDEHVEYWMNQNSAYIESTRTTSRLHLLARRVAEIY